MRGLILALAVGLATLFTAASEGGAARFFYSGQDLHERCGAASGMDRGLCVGYIQGVFDSGTDGPPNGGTEWPSGMTACVPEGVTSGQLTEVVTKWLREHPEDWHFSANSLAANALMATWPCP
jgi:hypothetical protein